MPLLTYPATGLCLLLALTLALLWQTQYLRFDNSAESFLNKNDPERLAYIDFEDRYGLSAYFIVFIRDTGLLTKPGIERIRLLQQAIEESVPHISETESIVSSRYIHSEGDDIAIEPLFPQELAGRAIAERRDVALDTPYYLDRLINRQGDATAIIVRMRQYAPDRQQKPVRLQMYHLQETLAALRKLIADFQPLHSPPILLGGSPTISVELTQSTRSDMLLFSLLALLIVASALFLLFRRGSAVLAPALCLSATVAIVLSLMAIGRYPLQVSSAILPSFLLAVGVADSIHFLRAFFPAYDSGMSKVDAIRKALNHVAVAMFFTTLTTSVGLWSFSFSKIAPVASFGIFAAVGVWVALLLTLLSLPALMLVLPLRRKDNTAARLVVWRSRLTVGLQLINRWRSWILAMAFFLLLLCIAVASRLAFSHNPLLWFAEDHPVREANRVIESSLAGTMQVELLISHNDPARALELEQLQHIDRWLQTIRRSQPGGIPVQSSVSVLDLLKEVNRVLQPGAGYALPDNQSLLAQEMLLLRFDPDNTLDKLVDNRFTEMRVSLSIPWTDSIAYTLFLDRLQLQFDRQLGDQLNLEITGMATVANKAFTEMIDSMAVSYLYAGLVVLTLVLLLLRNLRLGLLLAIPNLLPIAAVLAVMQWLSIPLDLFTMLIGSIAIGLIVDDSIHFVYSFQSFRRQGLVTLEALTETFVSTGTALVSTTLVLCSAFAVYVFSPLQNLSVFGLLTALCIALALLADCLLIPAILLRLDRIAGPQK